MPTRDLEGWSRGRLVACEPRALLRYALGPMRPKTVLPLAVLAAAALLMASAATVSAGASVPGDPKRGKALFLRPGLFCASCHTLKAVKSKGRDGPNLDKAKPSYALIVNRVTNGHKPSKRWPTGMPSYSGAHAFVNKAQIRDLAAFVYAATHR
jgi:mono/diheme cytochrome c family protein